MNAKEFRIKKGAVVYSQGAGTTILDVQGASGQMFSVVDNLVGLIHHVSDASGTPIFEVYSDNILKLGTYGSPGLIVDGSSIKLPNISAAVSPTGLLAIEADGTITSTSYSSIITGGGGVSGTIATGQIAFGTGAGVIGGDTSFIWDSVNNRLGIGTTLAPSSAIYLGNTFNSNYISLRADATTPTGFYGLGAYDSGTQVGIGFWAGTGGSTPITSIPRLFFTSGFLLGVNTNAPTNTLDVNGTTRIRTISNLGYTATEFLTQDPLGVISKRTAAETLADIGAQAALTNPVTGTGTTNYLSKFTGSSTIGDSSITDDGSLVILNSAQWTKGSYVSQSTKGIVGNVVSRNILAHLYQETDEDFNTTSASLPNGLWISLGASQSGTGTLSFTGQQINARAKRSTSGTSNIYGTYVTATRNDVNDQTTNGILSGGTFLVGHLNTSNPSVVSSTITAIQGYISNNVGTFTDAFSINSLGIYAPIVGNVSVGTNHYSFYSNTILGRSAGDSTATITNFYDIYLNGATVYTGSSITNRWGVYQNNSLHTNYFAANVLIGTTTDSGDKLRVNGTVRIDSVTNATGDIVRIDANNVLRRRTVAETLSDLGLGSALTGSGTANYVPFFNGSNSLTASSTFQFDSAENLLNVSGIIGSKWFYVNTIINNTNASGSINITTPYTRLVLTGNVTLTINLATIPANVTLQIMLTQDATGGRTVTWPTIKWAGGSAPTLTGTANSIDIVTITNFGGVLYGVISKGHA